MSIVVTVGKRGEPRGSARINSRPWLRFRTPTARDELEPDCRRNTELTCHPPRRAPGTCRAPSLMVVSSNSSALISLLGSTYARSAKLRAAGSGFAVGIADVASHHPPRVESCICHPPRNFFCDNLSRDTGGTIRRIGDHVCLSDWSPVEYGKRLPVVGGAALPSGPGSGRLTGSYALGPPPSDEIDEAPTDVAAIDSYLRDRIAFERRRQLVDARLIQMRRCPDDDGGSWRSNSSSSPPGTTATIRSSASLSGSV